MFIIKKYLINIKTGDIVKIPTEKNRGGCSMGDNIFKTDTKPKGKRDFLDRISVLYIAATLLTGICSIGGVIFLIRGVVSEMWREGGVSEFVRKGFFYLNTLFIWIALIKIAIDEKPFSKTLTWILRTIGILFLVASCIMPRLPGYQESGINIIWTKEFGTLCDGALLIPGLLLIIFSSIIRAGFDMQKEMDEIL